MPTQTTSVLMTTLQMSNAAHNAPAVAAPPQSSSSSSAPPSDVKSLFSHLMKMLEGKLGSI